MEFKWYGSTTANITGIGNTLRLKRIALGLSLFSLAHELNISVSTLEAIEAEAWHRLAIGQERSCIEPVANRLEVDIKPFLDYLNDLPAIEQELPDHYREPLEKVLVSAITVGSLALLCWLVIPGPSLKRKPNNINKLQEVTNTGTNNWFPKESSSIYPILGEMLPEIPVNEDGVLITMRAMDTCEAVVNFNNGNNNLMSNQGNMPLTEQRRTLMISEPWCFRAKGPFTIHLSNAGVVSLEVGGRRILGERHINGPWVGNFNSGGKWLIPAEPKLVHTPTVPETDHNIE